MKNCVRLLFCISFILIIAGCSQMNSYQSSLYNDNSKIASQGDSYTFRDRIGSTRSDNLSLTFSGFYGKQTIWRMDAIEIGSINLDVRTILKGGKFKICLVNTNKEVSVIAEGQNSKNVSISIPTGRSALVIIGNNADGEVNISLREKVNVSIEVISSE